MNTASTSNECNLFPVDPSHGDIFELQPGLLFQFDGTINSWVKVVSSSVVLPLVNNRQAGAMAAIDLKKLNRLVLPPPQATIIGTDCVAPFQRGTIEFVSGDQFVDVKGNLDLRNIDSFGDMISEEHAFHIHQHTYGFDFTLDLPRLVQELIRRDQIKLHGTAGLKGITGDEGDPGEDDILSGPKGLKGEQGLAPECDTSIDTEIVSADIRPGLKRALVAVRVIPNPTEAIKFSLEFDRQVVGKDQATVDQFNVKQSKSFWVLAVASIAGIPQPVFYLDIEPVIEAVRQKFLSEVNRLKQGYEDIVAFWIQTMSDLFDEQKDALCCALEFCTSKRKSVDLRQHMESIAAAAIGANGAKINLHGRNSDDAVEISNTRLLGQRIPDGQDLCQNGPAFPQNLAAGAAGAAGVVGGNGEASAQAIEPISVGIDPLLNTGSLRSSVQVELPRGQYSATIESTDTRIGTMHGGVIRIQHSQDGSRKVVQFLDKGGFDSLLDSQAAYEGLSLGFTHDGGLIHIYFPMIPTMNASGQTVIRIESSSGVIQPRSEKPIIPKSDRWQSPQVQPIERLAVGLSPPEVQNFTCQMTLSHLSWYQKGWDTGNCCGLVVGVSGQDYIIFKRSIGDDVGCGGGESEATPCIVAAKETLGQHPAFAWPTFDGKTFAPLPDSELVAFQFDPSLNELVIQQIAKSEYDNPKGNPAGYRHLVYQLVAVLFPVA